MLPPIYKVYTTYIHTALKYLPFYDFTLLLDLTSSFFKVLIPTEDPSSMLQDPTFFRVLFLFFNHRKGDFYFLVDV